MVDLKSLLSRCPGSISPETKLLGVRSWNIPLLAHGSCVEKSLQSLSITEAVEPPIFTICKNPANSAPEVDGQVKLSAIWRILIFGGKLAMNCCWLVR